MSNVSAAAKSNAFPRESRARLMLMMAFMSFISLGLYEGSIGVAWPSIRDNFDLPLDYLGMILIASTCGVLISSFNNGWLLSRIEFGSLLVIANLLRAAGMLGYAIVPEWWFVVASAVLVGLGAGTIDSGMNTFVAARYGPGPLNWLHSFYGLGAMISPIIMATLITNRLNWSWGFVAISIFQIVLAIYFAANSKYWPSRLLMSYSNDKLMERASSVRTLSLWVVWLGIAVFFFSTGVEISVGQWSFTLFTESRGVAIGRAGMWVSIFWASLTFGRILFGFITDRIGATRLLRLGMGGMVAGVLLYWWNPANWIGFLGLVLVGFCMAPIFPVMVGVTPARFKPENATNAIGFQIAAAYLGGAFLPALVGVSADALGLETIGAILFGISLLTVGLHEILVRKCGL